MIGRGGSGHVSQLGDNLLKCFHPHPVGKPEEVRYILKHPQVCLSEHTSVVHFVGDRTKDKQTLKNGLVEMTCTLGTKGSALRPQDPQWKDGARLRSFIFDTGSTLALSTTHCKC